MFLSLNEINYLPLDDSNFGPLNMRPTLITRGEGKLIPTY
jgi:hypothetical protein